MESCWYPGYSDSLSDRWFLVGTLCDRERAVYFETGTKEALLKLIGLVVSLPRGLLLASALVSGLVGTGLGRQEITVAVCSAEAASPPLCAQA